MAAEQLLLHEIRSGVLWLTLNRPDAANALLPEQRDKIIALLADADKDETIRAVVISAKGRHFCAGGDLRSIGQRAGATEGAAPMRAGDGLRTMILGPQKLMSAILDCTKPVVAAVQGTAAGMGAHIAFACDLIVASEEAAFIESYVLRGLVADAAGAYLLPRRIGTQKAKELLFFGDRISAQEAQTLGLVNKVVPADAFEAAVEEMAARLAAGPTLAIGLAKRLINESLDSGRSDAFFQEALAQEIVAKSEDVKEGVSAFVAKRQPSFKGY